jgi:tetraacyldisaccharide 4'-kinase
LKSALHAILRFATLPLAIPYGFIIHLRNKLYDWGLSESLNFSIPIINVGNLSVGGTGKTPHTEYLIELLQHSYSVATLSRGYKRYTRGFVLANEKTNARDIGDEPMQFFAKYPNISVCVCEDRILAVPQLMQRKPYTQVLLLDDAFQHRSIAPSLNILVTDYANLYTQDFILPFGRLREFRSGAARADIIIVSKCPLDLDNKQSLEITKQILPLQYQQVYFTCLKYGDIYQPLTQTKQQILDCNVLLVSGIANPKPLKDYVGMQAKMVHNLTYKDHYYFTTDDVADIIETYNNMPKGKTILLTTEKDYTRLILHQELFVQANIALHVLPVRVDFLCDGATNFEKQVLQHLLTYYPIIHQNENENEDYGKKE